MAHLSTLVHVPFAHVLPHVLPAGSGRSRLPLKTCGPVSEYMVEGLAKEMKDIIADGRTFRWQSQSPLGDSTRHKPLMNISINSVRADGGTNQTVNLEICPLSVGGAYGAGLPSVSWRMNAGTTGSPDAFLDTNRMFTKTGGPIDKVTIDLGTTTQFIETLEQSKDVLVFTIFIKNPTDPDISTLLQERREQRDAEKNLSHLLGIHSKLFNDPCPETVRFVFPLRSGRKKYLYALETVLRSAKYFSNLLDSQFSETSWSSGSDDVPSSSKRARLDLDTAPSPPTAVPPEQSTSTCHIASSSGTMLEEDGSGDEESAWWNGDSDDETEDPSHEIEEYEMPAERFKATVVVTDTPYITYRALLKYLFSGSICFAPLRSTYLAEKRAAKRKGEDFESLKDFTQRLSTKVVITECQLTPTSPKSIYVLADKLIMPELQQLAKQQILNSLTPSNIFNEIKTDMCIRYPDLRNSYIKYLKQNRNEAMSSDTLQEIVISALGKSGKEIEEVVREVFQKSLVPYPPIKLPTPASVGLGGGVMDVGAAVAHEAFLSPQPYPHYYDYNDEDDFSDSGDDLMY